jgi:hypothetical protein
MTTPPDVLRHIIGYLQKDICPIYSESDVQRDIVHISLAFDVVLKEYKLVDTLPKTYTKDYAQRMTRISNSELRPLNTVTVLTKSKKGKMHQVALGKDVRKFMRDKYDGNIIQWIADQCLPTVVKKWFIQCFQPFISHDPIPVESLRKTFQIIEEYKIPNDERVRAFLKTHKDNLTQTCFNEQLINQFATFDKRKDACIECFTDSLARCGIREALEQINELQFIPRTYIRAISIRESCVIKWISKMHLEDAVKFILTGDGASVIKELKDANRRDVILDVARTLNLDDGEASHVMSEIHCYSFNDKLEEICERKELLHSAKSILQHLEVSR